MAGANKVTDGAGAPATRLMLVAPLTVGLTKKALPL